MDFEFRNKELVKLYTTGRSRKYKLQPEVIKRFVMRIRQIEGANGIYDLWQTVAIKFKRLKGFQNRYSLRIDKKWRLEIEVEWEDEQQTTGKVYIIEVSLHYGD